MFVVVLEAPSCAKLFPHVNDEILQISILLLLQKTVDVSLLWRVRRISEAWTYFVGDIREWTMLDVDWVDTPIYLIFLHLLGMLQSQTQT